MVVSVTCHLRGSPFRAATSSEVYGIGAGLLYLISVRPFALVVRLSRIIHTVAYRRTIYNTSTAAFNRPIAEVWQLPDDSIN
jgi:hypothetical protein